MNHNEFFDQLEKEGPRTCYLFEGEEEYIKRSAFRRLRDMLTGEMFRDMNVTVLHDPAPDVLLEAVETLPITRPDQGTLLEMMTPSGAEKTADRRLVVVMDSSLIAGRGKAGDDKKAFESVEKILKNLPDTVCLLFYTEGKADSRKKLTALLKKTGCAVSFEALDDVQLGKWIAREIRRRGKNVTADTVSQIRFALGNDLYTLSSELDKLCGYAMERDTIDSSDLEAVGTKTTSYRVYDLASQLLCGEADRAFATAESLQHDGEEGLPLLALLTNECRRGLTVKIMRAEGAPQDTVAKSAGIPSFAVGRLERTVRRYSAAQLKCMLDACVDVEYRVKSGKLPQQGALELAMLHILNIQKTGEPHRQ